MIIYRSLQMLLLRLRYHQVIQPRFQLNQDCDSTNQAQPSLRVNSNYVYSEKL